MLESKWDSNKLDSLAVCTWLCSGWASGALRRHSPASKNEAGVTVVVVRFVVREDATAHKVLASREGDAGWGPRAGQPSRFRIASVNQ